MTQLLEHAVETLRNLSPDMQDELAGMMLQVMGEEQPAVYLSIEDESSFDESLAQAESGDFAADANIRAIWAKHEL